MNELATIIRELIELLGKLTAIEQEKREAARKNLVSIIEDSMKEEQACVLKLRGLDRRREEAQKKAGWENYTFKQILEAASPQERKTLAPLFDEMSIQMTLLKDAEESSRKVIEMNLHELEILTREAGGKALYSKDGSRLKAPRSFTSKKI